MDTEQSTGSEFQQFVTAQLQRQTAAAERQAANASWMLLLLTVWALVSVVGSIVLIVR